MKVSFPANADCYAFTAIDPSTNSDPLGLYSWGEEATDRGGVCGWGPA